MKKAKKWYNNDAPEFFDPEIDQMVYRVTMGRWMSQDEKDLQSARFEAGNAMAEYFSLRSGIKNKQRTCACLGTTCNDFGCPALWSMIIDRHFDRFLEMIKRFKSE